MDQNRCIILWATLYKVNYLSKNLQQQKQPKKNKTNKKN